MYDYVKPSLKFKTDLFILHCGTNDHISEKSPEAIANNIVNLAVKMKQPDDEIMISSIASRRDELNQQAVAVNNHLKVLCYNDYIEYIDNSNISSGSHLNNSCLHSNLKGPIALSNNFIKNILSILTTLTYPVGLT